MEGNYTVSYKEVMIFQFPQFEVLTPHDQDQGSIQFLYDITNIFLRPIIEGDLFPEGFLTPEEYPDIGSLEQLPNDIIDNYEDIINQNMNFISAGAFGIVFAILRLMILNAKRIKYNVFSVCSCFLDSVVVSAAANSQEKNKIKREIKRLLGWF